MAGKGTRKFVRLYSNPPQRGASSKDAYDDPWNFSSIRIAKTISLELQKPGYYDMQSSQQNRIRQMAVYDENIPPPSTQPRNDLRLAMSSSPLIPGNSGLPAISPKQTAHGKKLLLKATEQSRDDAIQAVTGWPVWRSGLTVLQIALNNWLVR
ncbi:hypothetical protein BDN70DRAFT_901572 [Pholiota conissans]|uniref:Uncharacterized protein n=1 Tax=Pholiota conissans TaxID=109636 RepID=A0A9P5YLL3_9AGAR|nr:hypothetical protein BDN70DRAFT_901572 [Pholiota conissans]